MRYLKYYYPAQDLQAIALKQDITSAGNLKINGTLANFVNNAASFINKGYIHQVAITSTNDLSAANFTITGEQNGVAVVETISGPNNNSVYTTNFFDAVSQVSVNKAVNGVSVGAGNVGVIIIYPFGAAFSCSIECDDSENPLGSAIYSSLDDIPVNGLSILQDIADKKNTLFPIKEYSQEANFIATPVNILNAILFAFVSNQKSGATVIFYSKSSSE